MKRETLSMAIFLATIIAISIPMAMLASGAATDTFESNVTIGNSVPDLFWVETGVNENPTATTTKEVQISFNATDNNSVSDFNDTSAFVNITKSAVTLTSHTCTPLGNTGNTEQWTCNITINYYQEPGADWAIVAYVADFSDASDTNSTATMQIGNADHVDVINATIGFSGSAGEQDVGPSNILMNNTGNQVYTNINITAYDLAGAASSDPIGVGNFTVNVTDGSGDGEALTDSIDLQITDAALARRTAGSTTEELFFYVDIPNGIEDDEYTASSDWEIDPIV